MYARHLSLLIVFGVGRLHTVSSALPRMRRLTASKIKTLALLNDQIPLRQSRSNMSLLLWEHINIRSFRTELNLKGFSTTISKSAFSELTQSSSRNLLRYSFCKAMAEFPSTCTGGGRCMTDTDAPTDTADDLLNVSLVKLFSKNRSSQPNSDHVFPRKCVSPALHFSHRPLGMIPYGH